MPPQDPNPLDYRTPGREPPPGRPTRTGPQFFIGLGVGSIASLTFWLSVMHINAAPAVVWGFLLVKFLAAIVFLCFPGKRAIGAGLLVSFVIGFMIFFSICAANFKV